MAPALTEPGQTQNLQLHSSHSSPGSPTAALRAASDEIFFCDISKHLKSDNILNGDSVCINRIKLNSSYGNLKPNRPRIVIPAESCLTPCLDVVSDCKGENGERSLMMNSDSPNQDQSSNMGLQKSHPGMTPTLEAGGFLKESFLPQEMDQLFKNLGAAINSSDIGPNMDELLQVFKSIESTVGDATLEDALSAAQEQVDNSAEDGIFPIPDGADLTSAFTNFERDIFNDVEINEMNICVDPQANISDVDTSLQPAKESDVSERIEEARNKQFQSERRCEFLLRRLKKLQAKSMGRHASEEINGLMQETHRLMAEAQTQSQPVEGVREKRLPRTITRMLRQCEESAHTAANSRHPQHRYFGSGSSDRTATVPSGLGSVEIGADVRAEVEKVAGQLHTQFRMVENALDSDVTASSSGGESCDEMVSFNNPHQQPLSIMRRAAWRWAQERAGVASRWTWLQAQISDLEYRIRQHTEIHRQIRLSKGEVKLSDPPGHSSDPAQAPNGFHTSSLEGVKELPECMGATGTCRTRPFVRTNFRKRRLLNTAGLHLVSKKAARASNIRCGCRQPLACCALCTGRSDPTNPREQPDLLTVQERIALLDPAYHPVLSFPSDVPQSIHLEALMRTPEWQQKMQRAAHKSSHRLLERREREREREVYEELRGKKHVVDHRKKYQRLKKPGHTLAIQKIKKKLTRGRKPKNLDAESLLRHKRKHKFRRNSSLAQSGYGECGSEELRVEITGSSHPSPAPSPGDDRVHSFAAERTESLRRKRENSYDIDNIVIPHSLASSARVEKLQYKEILTPKWRVIEPDPPMDTKNGGIRRSSHESDVEDVSDEAVMQRHERCEMEERKRFMAYVKNAHPGRPRAHRRTDSRAGSSGANTPDPMSPNTPADLGDGVSPITSPPATPGAPTAEHDPCSSVNIASISSHFARRHRTLSQSRLAREEPARSATPDYDDVAPFEPRSFPLSDELYEKMLKAMPDWYPAPPYVGSNPSSVVDQSDLTDVEMQDNTDIVGESLPGTPSTDTDSAPGEEDPNDPEWTIGEKESVKR